MEDTSPVAPAAGAARIPAPAQELLQALEAPGSEHFLALRAQHESRADGCTFDDLLQTLPKKQRARLATALLTRVSVACTTLEALLLAKEQSTEDSVGHADQLEATGAVLHGAAVLTRLLLLECSSAQRPPDLHAVTEKLHDEAFLRADFSPPLQEAVAKLCESWWQAGHSERESLVAQTLPYLLVKSLNSGRQADVKRVHAMRAALLLFDFDDESIVSLKKLLLRCAFAPEYLRYPEGRRFLSALFCLQPQLSKELMAIVRNQIPSGRKSVLQAYGEVLFRAWRTAAGPCLLELEYGCIQGLAKACLHASTPSMAAALRAVLDGFHTQKSVKGVDEMLLRVYEPLLFRSLQAANPTVRENAAQLLFACFPLQDPSATNEEVDASLSQQFKCLAALLKDPCTKVRATAVPGVIGILDTYWELIPAATTAGFIACVVDELVHDTSSAAVRTAAVTSLGRLVHNPLAQPVLKAVLPRLKGLLFDVTQRVRLALVDLLIEVRCVRAIRFYEVAPLELLLTALATDAAPMQRRLTRLLLPSYCPAGGTMDQVVERCVALLEQQPKAGAALCRHMVAEGAPAGTALALAAALRGLLLRSRGPCDDADADLETEKETAKRKKASGKRRKAQEVEANADDAAAESAAEELHDVPPHIWETIAGGIAALAESLVGNLPRAKLVELFDAEAVMALLQKAPTEGAMAAVLRAAQTVPASQAGSLKLHCQTRLLAPLLPAAGAASQVVEDDLRGAELVGWLRCMCVWDGAGELSTKLEAALAAPPAAAAAGDRGNTADGTVRASKRSKPAAAGAPPAATAACPAAQALAVRYLGLLLEDDVCRDKLIAGGNLQRLLPCVRAVAAAAAAAAGEAEAGAEVGPAAAAALLTYSKAAMHLDLEGRMTAAANGDAKAAELTGTGEAATAAVRSVCRWVSGAFEGFRNAVAAAHAARAAAKAAAKGAEAAAPTGKKKKGAKVDAPKLEAETSPLPAPSKEWAERVGMLLNAALAVAAEAAALCLLSPTDDAATLATEVVEWLHTQSAAAAAKGRAPPAALAASALSHAGRLAHRLVLDAVAAAPAGASAAPLPAPAAALAATVVRHVAGWEDTAAGAAPLQTFLPELVQHLTAGGDPAWIAELARVVHSEQQANQDVEGEEGEGEEVYYPTRSAVVAAVAARSMHAAFLPLALKAALAAWSAARLDEASGAVDLSLQAAEAPAKGQVASPAQRVDALSEELLTQLRALLADAKAKAAAAEEGSEDHFAAARLATLTDRLVQHRSLLVPSAA